MGTRRQLSTYYLDSSVALHALLPGGAAAARLWVDEARMRGDRLVSSSLLGLELARVLRRESLDPSWARSITERVDQVSVNDGVVRFAASLEPHLKSLDALHLATCLLLGPEVTLVTHDLAMSQGCRVLDIDVFDPLSGSRELPSEG